MFLDKSFCDRSKPPVCWVLMAAVKYVGAMFPCLLKLFLTFSLSGLGPLINLSFRIINQANPRHRNGTVKKHLNKTTHWKKTGVFYWEALNLVLVNNTLKSHLHCSVDICCWQFWGGIVCGGNNIVCWYWKLDRQTTRLPTVFLVP